MIDGLIDKRDNFEIIRDEIAAILATETANQQALAQAAGKDPDEWKLRVFVERSNPWEQYLNGPSDCSPLVNVWYDGSNFIESSSQVVERQTTEGIFNIDLYGYGKSKRNGTGHKPGDREAAFEVQKAIRLVRNILMAAEYTYLNLRGVVGQRWPQSISTFQPSQGSNTVQQIVGARIAFRVRFNELAPQVVPVTLDTLTATVKRAETGEVYVEAEYN